MGSKRRKFEHDVAISYAGEDRAIARQIAEALTKRGLSVFYDQFFKSDLWGKKLSKWFKSKYGKASRFVLVLISHNYSIKDWTDFEFSTAKAEESKRKSEFILPVRLDGTKIPGLPSDKVYLDFTKDGINGIADCLFDKVRKATGERDPKEVFKDCYEEWKMTGFLPGEAKVRYILDNIGVLSLDVDTCELLLRSLTGYYPDVKEKLHIIDKQVLFDAAIRMLDKKENNYTRWRAIRYLVFADPQRAGPHLCGIYKDYGEDLGIRTESFKRLWKCASKEGIDESYTIAPKEQQWQLRQAAVKNIGHGKVRKETSTVLQQALKDKRGEVRSETAYAIVRLKLNDLAPDLVHALESERSRKCANQLLYCLWNFNTHPSVVEFMGKYNLPRWFGKTPDYHALVGDLMDDML